MPRKPAGDLTPSGVFGLFERLVNLVDRKPRAVFLAAFLLLVTGISYIGYQQWNLSAHQQRLTADLSPTAETETSRFHAETRKSIEVHAALEDLRQKIGSDRVAYNLFSNNTKGLSGVPWSFTSVQDIALAPGVAMGNLTSGDKLPNAMFSEFYVVMWERPFAPSCAWYEADKLRSSLLRARLAERGTRFIAACPIQSADGATPLGAVYADFLRLDGDEPPKAKILDRLNGVAKDISAIIK